MVYWDLMLWRLELRIDHDWHRYGAFRLMCENVMGYLKNQENKQNKTNEKKRYIGISSVESMFNIESMSDRCWFIDNNNVAMSMQCGCGAFFNV